MKLSIIGIGRIAQAELDLNGITVLVGDNNTGKTTVGKVLYAFFSSFSNKEKRIFSMRKSKCDKALNDFGFWFDDISFDAFLKSSGGAEEKLEYDISHGLRGTDPFGEDSAEKGLTRETINVIMSKLRAIRDLDDHEIAEQIATNTYRQIFSDDYMPAKPRGIEHSCVCLTLKGIRYGLTFEKSGVHFEICPSLEHDAYFVDTPDLVEDIEARYPCVGRVGIKFARRIARNMQPKDDPGESAIDDIFADRKLERVLSRVDSVIHGKVSNSPNGRIGYFDAEMGASFRLKNISRGVRAFALLAAAIRSRVLTEYDVLILDEPEIHLHPEWLMDYAELLVLLQEEFNLTILVTTHSAYFLQALQLYARKHGRSAVLNAYKSVKADDGNVEICEKLPSDNWDKAYLSFLMAANKLRLLRDEVNAGEEEPS